MATTDRVPAARRAVRWGAWHSDRVELRIGHGIDVHRFSDDPSRQMMLGGVRFDGEIGLHGHSDADAVIHAAIDALLGAAGLGDIGMHFPDTDPAWAGADSAGLLTEALARVRAEGWSVANVDCTVVLERPKLAPRRAEMEQRMSELVEAPVSIKATRAEGLGAIGRAEGVACTAVALLRRDEGQGR